MAEHAAAHPAREIPVGAVMAGQVAAGDLADWAAAHAGRDPMLYSTAAPEAVAEVQRRHGREAVSACLRR